MDSAFQRALAAWLAILLRRFWVSFLALAGPPLSPPILPSATAAGFLSPMSVPPSWATMLAAIWLTSLLLECLCI